MSSVSSRLSADRPAAAMLSDSRTASRACRPGPSAGASRVWCLARLREAGMALEAVQAQAGHRSIESTRIYLHLANGWLSAEYHRAVDAIDAEDRR